MERLSKLSRHSDDPTNGPHPETVRGRRRRCDGPCGDRSLLLPGRGSVAAPDPRPSYPTIGRHWLGLGLAGLLSGVQRNRDRSGPAGHDLPDPGGRSRRRCSSRRAVHVVHAVCIPRRPCWPRHHLRVRLVHLGSTCSCPEGIRYCQQVRDHGAHAGHGDPDERGTRDGWPDRIARRSRTNGRGKRGPQAALCGRRTVPSPKNEKGSSGGPAGRKTGGCSIFDEHQALAYAAALNALR